MAHNPKLNVYVIELRKKDKNSVNSFFDYYNLLSNNNLNIDDKQGVFEYFMESFVDFIGGEEKFTEDISTKKVFGIDKKEDDSLNLKIDIDQFILSGILEGGKYGISRQSADIKDKYRRKDIPNTDAILDKFYFLMHTPLNSNHGYLIIQSYTEETILSPFLKKVEGYFYRKNDIYFSVKIEQFVPKKFIEKFKRGSVVKDIKYATQLLLDDFHGNQSVEMDSSTFDIEIRLKPKAKISPTSLNINNLKRYFKNLKFNEIQLGKFNVRKVYIKDNANKKANFALNEDIDSIKPTIYLKDTDVVINENGIPDYESIHNYCLSLLQEIDEEFKSSIRDII